MVVALAESTDKSDVIVLRIPRGGGSLPVVRVVIGGVASRHALPVDSLDDLELAVEALLREEPAVGGQVTLALSVEDATLKVGLAGLLSPLVRNALSRGPHIRNETYGAESVLCMILDALVDSYRMAEGVTADSFDVEMEKRIA